MRYELTDHEWAAIKSEIAKEFPNTTDKRVLFDMAQAVRDQRKVGSRPARCQADRSLAAEEAPARWHLVELLTPLTVLRWLQRPSVFGPSRGIAHAWDAGPCISSGSGGQMIGRPCVVARPIRIASRSATRVTLVRCQLLIYSPTNQ
jgi:hypothetical protein